MNNYGNVLLDEYYSMAERQISMFHTDEYHYDKLFETWRHTDFGDSPKENSHSDYSDHSGPEPTGGPWCEFISGALGCGACCCIVNNMDSVCMCITNGVIDFFHCLCC